MGRPIYGVMEAELTDFWTITSRHIVNMYKIVLRDRAGI